MNILVIAPHMDDEVLGPGGTICKHVAAGDTVKVLFVSNRVYNHQLDQKALEREEEHAMAAKSILNYQEVEFARLPDEQLYKHVLDVLDVIERVVEQFGPDIAYVNHCSDIHQDHKTVFEAAMIGFRSLNRSDKRIRRVSCYETPSSTEQAPPFPDRAFLPNFYVDICPYINSKQEAMACYKTEQRTFPHPRSAEGIGALAKVRGMACGFPAAEAFMVIREEWR